MTASASSSPDGSRLSRARLRDWYSTELETKVVRAVAEGHVTATQAVHLHRLVGELLGPTFRNDPRSPWGRTIVCRGDGPRNLCHGSARAHPHPAADR